MELLLSTHIERMCLKERMEASFRLSSTSPVKRLVQINAPERPCCEILAQTLGPWHGAHQGCILSAMLFNMYMRTLKEIIWNFIIRHCKYEENTKYLLSPPPFVGMSVCAGVCFAMFCFTVLVYILIIIACQSEKFLIGFHINIANK